MSKIQVSAAAVNTNVLKANKKMMKLNVEGVKVGGEVRRVRFIARSGRVFVRSAGLQKFTVRQDVNGEFFAKVHGQPVTVTGKTPQKTFAEAVKAYWM